MKFRKGQRVCVHQVWHEVGRCGTVLGPAVFVEQSWTPIKWDDEDDPDFFKTAGLTDFSHLAVHHKDGNPRNNDRSNLEIVDIGEHI
jgi:hypothetical protein